MIFSPKSRGIHYLMYLFSRQYCKICFVAGPDWAVTAGQEEGISQIARKVRGRVRIFHTSTLLFLSSLLFGKITRCRQNTICLFDTKRQKPAICQSRLLDFELDPDPCLPLRRAALPPALPWSSGTSPWTSPSGPPARTGGPRSSYRYTSW